MKRIIIRQDSDPDIVTRTYQEYGCEVRENVTPAGYVDIDAYDPSVTPWDCYGHRHQGEYGAVLAAASVPFVRLVTSRRILHPHGTGPYGRVRFGDDMTPGTYRLAVPVAFVEKAKAAFIVHEKAVHDALLSAVKYAECHNGEFPAACRG